MTSKKTKRTTTTDQSEEEDRRKRKKENDDEELIGTIMKKTGVSRFMLDVFIDAQNKNNKYFESSILLNDVICANDDIMVMNKEVIERERASFIKDKEIAKRKKITTNASSTTTATPKSDKKSKQTITDDMIRKYIIEKREKEILQNKVVIGGTNERETLPVKERDFLLIWEYLGYAKTNRGYYLFVYYTGPSYKGIDNIELKNPSNWHIVHKSHLIHFHKRIGTQLTHYLKDTLEDQESANRREYPSYDPRFIINKWIESKNGKQYKPLIISNKDAFQHRKDWLIKHWEEEQKSSNKDHRPYYYNDSAEVQEEDDPSIFNVEKDRLRQQQNGFMISNEDFSHLKTTESPGVVIDQWNWLSRYPISKETTFSFDELKKISQRAVLSLDQPPEFYKWQPISLINALIIAFNQEHCIKRITASLCDSKTQILEKDNIIPIFEEIFNDEECQEEIKLATMEYIWSVMAVDFAGRAIPQHAKDEISKNKHINPFTLLEI